MKLHENQDEFKAAISEAAAFFKLPEHVIEKDYWVTKLLFNLNKYNFKQYVIFKGGTSLSKGHRLIKRFSEDIDLALHPEGIGKGKIHHKEGEALYRVTKALKNGSFKDEEGNESEGKRYKRIYSFPQSFDYPPESPIHNKIVLEVNSFTIPAPTEAVNIQSLVSEHLEEKHGIKVIQELDLVAFQVEALKPERTFCEKLLALRRANYRGGEFFSARIRHVYDIHQLFSSDRIQDWLKQPTNFHDMLKKAHADDELNQKISDTVARDFNTFKIFSAPEEEIEAAKSAYDALKDITFDRRIPTIKEVSNSLTNINDLLKGFSY